MGPKKFPYGAKTEAIKAIFAAQGSDVGNEVIRAVLRPKFGTVSDITIHKARLSFSKRPRAEARVKALQAAASFSSNGHASGVLIEHVRAAKEFVKTCGSRDAAHAAFDELASLME